MATCNSCRKVIVSDEELKICLQILDIVIRSKPVHACKLPGHDITYTQVFKISYTGGWHLVPERVTNFKYHGDNETVKEFFRLDYNRADCFSKIIPHYSVLEDNPQYLKYEEELALVRKLWDKLRQMNPLITFDVYYDAIRGSMD